MTSNSTDLVFEYLVVESRFEFALALIGLCDFRSILATAEDDEVFLWGDGCGVEWCIGRVGLEDLEVTGGEDLCGFVSACCDEVCAVLRELEVVDLGVDLVGFH